MALLLVGDRGSPALRLGDPQSPALRHQAPQDGLLGGRPRLRVSPQEAGKPDRLAMRSAEQWPEVRALASGSVGPSVLARGAFECLWGLGKPCPLFRHE